MNKSIIPLVLIVAFAVVAGLLVLPEQRKTDTTEGYAFELLKQNAALVDRVTIENVDGMLFDANKEGENWLSALFGNYPVNTDALGTLLQQLVQTKLVEPKTSKSEYYARLGVEPISSENASSVLITLYQGDAKLVSLLAGSQSASGNSYIRLPDEQQSWLIDKSLSLPLSNTEWLAQPILGIALEKVSAIEKLPRSALSADEKGEGRGWEISRGSVSDPTAEGFNFSPAPVGASLKYPSVLSNAASTILNLEFESIAPNRMSLLPAIENSQLRYRIELISGESVVLNVIAEGAEKWLAFSDYTKPEKTEDVQLLVFAERFELLVKWRYFLSDYSVGQLDKNVQDFFDLAESPNPQDPQ